MISKSDIEKFWTRGDIFSRVHPAMSEAGLIYKKLEIDELLPISTQLGVMSIPVIMHSHSFA